ncbi:unnamed protein product, partial [Laminaria digitata]
YFVGVGPWIDGGDTYTLAPRCSPVIVAAELKCMLLLLCVGGEATKRVLIVFFSRFSVFIYFIAAAGSRLGLAVRSSFTTARRGTKVVSSRSMNTSLLAVSLVFWCVGYISFTYYFTCAIFLLINSAYTNTSTTAALTR